MSVVDDRRGRRALAGAAVLVAGGLLALPRPAAALVPGSGGARVDGSAAEWSSGDDVAALVGNDPPHLERGRLSLRYDCAEEVLYALLSAGPGLRLRADDPGEAYLRFGSEPKLVSGRDEVDGEAPDAEWIDLTGTTAAGIEMSTPLAPGSHPDLRVHAKIPDDSADGYETVDLLPRYEALDITCATATDADPAVDLRRADGSGDTLDPRDPGDRRDPSDLARTGAPAVPALVLGGATLLAGGAALRLRRPARPARP